MRIPAPTALLRRQPLFGPAVLLLILVAVAAAIWAGTSPAGAQDSGELQVSVTADPANPEVNESTRLTATIANPPSAATPSYDWEIDFGGTWYSYGSGPTFQYGNGKAETLSFRVTVSYDSGETARSEAVAVTWVDPTPTPEPTPTPTPEPTEEPTPEPTQEPTPEPTQEPTPEPTQEPTPEPTQEPTPTPPPAPSVARVAVTSDAGDDATYILGDVIRITLTFSENVDVTGTPQLKIDMDPADWGEKWAAYASGSGTDSLTFAHTVVEPNYSTQGIAVLENSLELNGGSIKSASSDTEADLAHTGRDHDPEHKVDWRQSPITTPTVSAVEITSDAGDEDTYLLGDVIRVTLTFSERVNVTGSPRLKIDMDPAEWGEKQASYHSGSGTAGLTFAHTVVEPNLSTRGIAVLEDSLELNGGSIKSTSSDTDAELSHDGRDHDPNHKVDWQRTQPNRAPVVDTEARSYELFTGQQNIPRGFLFSKSFYQVVTDPDGDELTYSVSMSEHDRQLLDDLSIGLDYRTSENSHRPLTVFHRVWFEVDGEDDWKGKSPALSDPVVVTATLTATDPEGMSVSLDGSILIDWESHPEVVTASASERAIELTFDVAVIDDPAPTAGQFTVNVVNGDGIAGTVSVSSVSVTGAVVTLGLGTELASGQTVTVDYAHDDDTPLKRAAAGGDAAAGFQGQTVNMSMLGLPGAVSNLEVIAEPGQLDLLARWNEVEGATSYRLRWREDGEEFEADNAATVSVAILAVTVSGYGQWEVRAQGCSDDGCGPEAAVTVDVVPEASLSLERAVDDQGQVRPRTLSANWDPVERAASYLLRWWPANEDPPATAQQSSDASQARSIGRRGANTQTSNQLTVPAGRTGVEFTVPDGRAYRVGLQARGSGNEIIARGDAEVDQAPGQPDTTAPRLVRGEVDGDTMVFYFSEALDEGGVGARFSVSMFSPSRWSTTTTSYSAVSGNKVTIHLWGGIRAKVGEHVRAYYFVDDRYSTAEERLRDLAGNEVSTPYLIDAYRTHAHAFPRTRTIWLDNLTAPPSLQRATVRSRWLTLTFDERLDGNSVPAAGDFTVRVNGSAVSLADHAAVVVDGSNVTLVLATPALSTDVVTVSYAKPSASPLRGVDGDAPSFSGRSVVNRVGVVPAVSQVEITSTPVVDNTYALGESIRIKVTFTEAVGVSGSPRLRIKLDPAYGEKWADYADGSGTATLEFAYTVVEPDRSTRGVAVPHDSLDLRAGAIRSVDMSRRHANLWHGELNHDPNHQVDGVPPSLWSAAMAEETKLTLSYDETLDKEEVSVPAASAFTVKVNGSQVNLASADPVGVTGDIVTLTLAAAVAEDDTVTVSYTKPSLSADDQLRDLVGNEAASFTDQAVISDGAASSLWSATATGTRLVMSYYRFLDEESVPAASAFTVKKRPRGGSEETVSLTGSPTIDGATVTLTLPAPVLAGDKMTVSYAKPTAEADHKLKDLAGNEAESFPERRVDATDTTPPRIVRGEVDGDTMTLYFSELLDENSGGEGDVFRPTLRFRNISITFTAEPREVIVSGNKVMVVGMQQATQPGYERNRVKYYRTLDPTHDRLRDLAGNPVYAPYDHGAEYRKTREVPLDNVTGSP